MVAMADSHWVRWHEAYADPASPLSVRLGLVQAALRCALDEAAPGPVRVLSLCAGQGRDVIDVVAGHDRAADVTAVLVELDPALVAFARDRAATVGVEVSVVEGDAGRCAVWAAGVPAEVVLACGLFGNISEADLVRTVAALPGVCPPGGSVIWTRHRRPPDRTPLVREAFAAAGFEEVSFEAPPAPYVLAVGWHRRRPSGPAPVPFDPGAVLFEFVGDGDRPA
jgi:Methyltransferase domain